MGIDYGTVDPATGDFEHADRFASVGGFYHLVHVMSHFRPMLWGMREHGEELRQMIDSLDEWLAGFVGPRREESEAAFARYCAFTTSVADEMKNDPERQLLNPATLDHMYADPSMFDAEVCALFGRMIMLEEPIEPDDAGWFSNYGGAFGGLFKGAMAEMRRGGDEESAAAVGAALATLEPLRDFAERCANEGKAMVFSP